MHILDLTPRALTGELHEDSTFIVNNIYLQDILISTTRCIWFLPNKNVYLYPFTIKFEGVQIELEHSASDANINILSRDSRQPIIVKPPSGGGFFNLWF